MAGKSNPNLSDRQYGHLAQRLTDARGRVRYFKTPPDPVGVVKAKQLLAAHAAKMTLAMNEHNARIKEKHTQAEQALLFAPSQEAALKGVAEYEKWSLNKAGGAA